MIITFFEIQTWEKKVLAKRFAGHKLNFFPKPLNAETLALAKPSQIVSVFIGSKISAEIVRQLKKTKLIVTRSTGFDHIDLQACRRQKISVANIPFYGENTVAEHTFALILSLSRNIHLSYLRTIRDDFSIEGLRGFDLKDKTIGVVGAGHIGLHVIKIARGFGLKVLAYDPDQNPFVAEVLEFSYVPLKELLQKSDIITLHVPDNKATHHLINTKNIKLIKKGAILINTARGGLVETDALIQALDKKILAGAGLDVLEGENLIKEEKQLLHGNQHSQKLIEFVKDHIILNHDKVVFTPHIAFYSQEALERILETTVENIQAFIKHQPKNLV